MEDFLIFVLVPDVCGLELAITLKKHIKKI